MDSLYRIDGRDRRNWECQRVYAQVDLEAVKENVMALKAHMEDHARMMAVIKADAYGHGSVPVGRYLEKLDFLFGFAVATVEEALELREAGIQKPVLILGYTFPYGYEAMIRESIRASVFREDMVREMSEAACRLGKAMKVHVKVDTGMSRIGISPDDSGIAFLQSIKELPGIEIEGIFTHFSRADERDKSCVHEQLRRFLEFLGRVREECGLEIPIKHCSNSASILELPEANMDLVRPGIVLYGVYPSDEVRRDQVLLRPALSLHSHVVYVKPLHPGQSVSYGGTFTAEKEMRIATVPVGYGDGYPRSLSNKGYVLIRGKRAPILGRICMDQFMADVTDIEGAKEGDPVTLIGRDGEDEITAESLGELSGRFSYELLCDLGKRIPRIYLSEGN